MLKNKLNFAAVDIGSNAVRLLIKGIRPGETPEGLTKSTLVRIPLRLGEDAFRDGEISAGKEKRLLRTIKSFKLLMRVFNVLTYRAIATSAMREASNGQEIAEKIRRKTGLRIEVIDGKEEARIVYDSHIGDLLQEKGKYIYVDVGGGSTEVSLIHNGDLKKSHSYNIGTVRSLEGKVKPGEWYKLKRDMEQTAEKYPRLKIIGSGGNINKLYRLGNGKSDNLLAVSRLRELYDTLESLSYEERMVRFKLNPDRADVIVPAAEIFLTIADCVNADTIVVPTIGIGDGVIHMLCVDYLKAHRA